MQIRREVEAIRAALRSPDLTVGPELRATADAYAAACRTASDRLTQCEALIQKGQRAEALRLAKLEPDLLDLVADLNFPERESWDERLLMVGLSLPPRPNDRLAEFLNRAFAEEQSAADLLRQVRLLALGRAPLRDRLALLRLLAKAEPDNTAWLTDLAEYESARHREMKEQVRTARKTDDWPLVRELSADGQAPEWRTPPPAEVLAEIDREVKRLGRFDAAAKLTKLWPTLTRAAARRDAAAARPIRDRVRYLCKERGLAEDDEVLRPMAPALAWLDELDKLDQRHDKLVKATKNLSTALDAEEDFPALAERYRAADRLAQELGEVLPEAVVFRYERRLSAQRRRELLVRALTVGTGVLCAAVLFGLLLQGCIRH